MDNVELEDAFYWDCPSCKQRNFGLPKVEQVTEEERIATIRRDDHLSEWEELPEDWETVDILTNPDEVTCTGCQLVFFVTHADDTED